MKIRSTSNNSHPSVRLSAFLLAVLLLPSACARQPQSAAIEEITFQSGEFTLVGDLRHNWADLDAFDIPHSWG